MFNKSLQLTPALRACVGQFLSRSFVVLLRKSIPQNHNLKTAAELGVKNLRVSFSVSLLVFNLNRVNLFPLS